MKNPIQKSSVLLFAAAIYMLGEFFRGDWFVNTRFGFFCNSYIENGKVYCHSPYLDTGLILIAAGEILAIAGLMLLFANKEGLRKWRWMSLVYLPLSALIVANTHQTGGWISFSPSPEHVTWLLGYFYLLLTFAIVVGTRYVARRSHTA